ncbi:hypothetical protein LOC68_00975 [Blastopirellula sp. JC732]|uniref:Uncharacterized protein n=1 Tax=Blastopirellula sediminis TaxID=2894196 RepID=A0A9X1SEM2_9BACT|nr:hypothetical protein [Blastopirellula sediminis]MCC9608240.1 hypothetical protein [Blastopirellula sediminis]MCC9626967.1 hypothetical protein [Blastopirellula sediminis]
MTRCISFFSFAAVLTGVIVSTSAASACPNDGRKIVYYSHTSPPPVVRTVQASVATVAKSTTVTAVRAVKTEVAAPPQIEVKLPEVEVGSTVRAAVSFLGTEKGHVLLHIGPVTHTCEILEWSTNSVAFNIPKLGLRSATPIELEVVRPDGRIVRALPMSLTPEAGIVIYKNPDPGFAVPSRGEAEIAETSTVDGTILKTSTEKTVTIAEGN